MARFITRRGLGLISQWTFGVPATAPLLDVYPTATFAYSLRLLRSAYAGSCIRVRRSSDNTEQDIGFVNARLDTVSLLSFCGASSGFVTKWYDQSGNASDAVQATSSVQPRIVNAGVLEVTGSYPKINFDIAAGTRLVNTATVVTTGTNRLLTSVFKIDTYKNFNVLYSNNVSNNFGLHTSSAQAYFFNGGTNNFSPLFNSTSMFLHSLDSTTTDINNGANTNTIVTATTLNGVIIGNSPAFSNNLSGACFEAIFWNFSQSPNQSTIKNLIRTYYGI